MTRTKIVVLTPQGKVITFHTQQSLDVREGMIFFLDERTKLRKGFPTGWCETEEVA